MYTFVWTLDQLDRATDLIAHADLRILALEPKMVDEFLAIVRCDSQQALLLYLI